MRHNQYVKLSLSLVLSTTCLLQSFHGVVQAQAVPGGSYVAPGTAGRLIPTPSQLPENTPEKRQQRESAPAPDTAPQIENNIAPPASGSSVQVQSPSFHVDKINIEGSTLFGAPDFGPIIAPYQGQTVTLDDLQKVVDKINALYRDKGYLTTQAFVPPQEVDKGMVTVKVVEGHVGHIYVTGNKYYRTTAIGRQLRIGEGDLFNIKDLESNLKWSNQNNNFRMKANLSPGESTGLTDVLIEVAEAQPWQITPTFDNQGRPYIGYYRGGVEVANDSLFGFGDTLATKVAFSDHTQLGYGSYFIPINKHGDQIGISYGYSHVNVDLGIPGQPHISGESNNIGLLYSHPFDRQRIFTGDLGLNYRTNRTLIDGGSNTREDVRSVQAGLNFNRIDHVGRTSARIQSAVGVGVLGGNDEFVKFEGFLTRLFLLPANNQFIIRGYGLVAPNHLPIVEQMQLGGEYSVRGYTEGVLLGDRGYNMQFEERFPIPLLNHMSPKLANSLQGAVFFDFGQAFLDKHSREIVAAGLSNGSDAFLASFGFGLRYRITQYLQGFVDVGFPIADKEKTQLAGYAVPTARIHFGIRSDLLNKNIKPRSTNKYELGKGLVSGATKTDINSGSLTTPANAAPAQDNSNAPSTTQDNPQAPIMTPSPSDNNLPPAPSSDMTMPAPGASDTTLPPATTQPLPQAPPAQ